MTSGQFDALVRELNRDSGVKVETYRLDGEDGFGISLRAYRHAKLKIDAAAVIGMEAQKAIDHLSREMRDARRVLAAELRALADKLEAA